MIREYVKANANGCNGVVFYLPNKNVERKFFEQCELEGIAWRSGRKATSICVTPYNCVRVSVGEYNWTLTRSNMSDYQSFYRIHNFPFITNEE